ncbi:FAD-dependent oxidoreductase [Kineococcus gynurae]|uniref:FAD-dependent oxidoreductase n=1 Tax=Kineococcus gynurae TaxID=452979 RepID=A0ABV5LNN3_9ACTN
MAAPVSPPRILVVGGGGPDGGLAGPAVAAALARRLAPREASISLVRPPAPVTDLDLLADVVVGALRPSRVSRELSETDLAADLAAVEELPGRLAHLDHTHRVARWRPVSGPERALHYDVLVLATPPRPPVGHEVPADLTELADATGAEELRHRLEAALDRADASRDPEVRDRALTVVVRGAGTPAVRLAAACVHVLRQGALSRNSLRRTDVRVLLRCPGPLLPTDPDFGVEVGARLRDVGVEVRIEGADGSGTPEAADVRVALPAAGADAGGPVVLDADLAALRTEPSLDADLRLTGLDAAWGIPGGGGPRAVRHAAEAVAANVVAELHGGRSEDYRAPTALPVVGLTPGRGLARVAGLTVAGRAAGALDRVRTLVELPTARRRAAVLGGWARGGWASRRSGRTGRDAVPVDPFVAAAPGVEA